MVALLAVALVIFLAPFLSVRSRRGPFRDFGTGFSLFLAGWMGAELASILSPGGWAEGVEVFHFAVLAAFAAWMNLRWRWALRRAQEAP